MHNVTGQLERQLTRKHTVAANTGSVVHAATVDTAAATIDRLSSQLAAAQARAHAAEAAASQARAAAASNAAGKWVAEAEGGSLSAELAAAVSQPLPLEASEPPPLVSAGPPPLTGSAAGSVTSLERQLAVANKAVGALRAELAEVQSESDSDPKIRPPRARKVTGDPQLAGRAQAREEAQSSAAAGAQRELAETRATLGRAQTQAGRVTYELTKTRERLGSAERRLEIKERELEKIRRLHGETGVELEAERAKLERRAKVAESKVAEMLADNMHAQATALGDRRVKALEIAARAAEAELGVLREQLTRAQRAVGEAERARKAAEGRAAGALKAAREEMVKAQQATRALDAERSAASAEAEALEARHAARSKMDSSKVKHLRKDMRMRKAFEEAAWRKAEAEQRHALLPLPAPMPFVSSAAFRQLATCRVPSDC